VERGGLDGWRMMETDDTGTDLWTIAGAWEKLEGGEVLDILPEGGGNAGLVA